MASTTLGLWYGQTQLYGVRITRVRQRAVYNGPDYLWTEKEIYGVGTLNSTTTNFGGGLSQGQDLNAVDFNRSYSNVMMNPRQRLRCGVGIGDSGDDNVFFSVSPADDPTEGDALDVQTGPEPIYFDLVNCMGSRTVKAEFGFKCSVVETGPNDDPPPVISNRWDQHHHYELDQRLVITTVGRAIFRRDALLKFGNVADDYRAWLLVPIPEGYARTMKVDLSQDGLTVTYTLVDRQQTYDAVAVQVAHMNVKVAVATDKPSLMDLGSLLGEAAGQVGVFGNKVGPGFGKMFGQAVAGKIMTEKNLVGKLGDIVGIPGPIHQMAENVIGKGWDVLAGILAQTQISITVEIIGTPTSEMPDLIDYAMQVLSSKSTTIKAFGAGRKVTLATDYDTRHLVMSRIYSLAPVSALFNGDNIDGTGGLDLGGQEMGSVFQDTVPNLYQTGVTKGPGQDDIQDIIGVSGGGPALLNLVAAALQPPLSDPSQLQTPPVKAPQIPESETDHLESPTATE